MTDKVQKIRAFLVGIADADGVSTILAKAIKKEILPYIDSLQKEPECEDLLKASMEFEKVFGEWRYAMPCFLAGAVWQKSQVIGSLPMVITFQR